MQYAVSPINQLTAWVTLAALLTGCATPGTRTIPGESPDGIPAIIAAMEKEDAEGRSTGSRDMVELPEAMRQKIEAFLAPPAGPGIENMELRYARPYVFDAQAAGEFGYTPLPTFRRESRRGVPIKRNIKWNQAAFSEWAADNQWGAPELQAVLDKWEESVGTARNSVKDFDTFKAAENRFPQGIWSDGTTMWVSDYYSHKIYAYSMRTKERDSAKDFDTLKAAGNRYPDGIWSDGTTMWVSDYYSHKIYAYSMRTKRRRDSANDFDTLKAAGNRSPGGIWSDGTTMWVADSDWDVVDWGDEKIYAYNQVISTKIKHIVQQQMNRQQRGYIEAVDRATGTVTIIWPDLIPPESQP